MNKPMTRTEWMDYLNKTWSEAVRRACEEEIAKAIEEEREACAQVCEGHYDTAKAARAIRARGEE